MSQETFAISILTESSGRILSLFLSLSFRSSTAKGGDLCSKHSTAKVETFVQNSRNAIGAVNDKLITLYEHKSSVPVETLTRYNAHCLLFRQLLKDYVNAEIVLSLQSPPAD
ncbi:hypothetical protein CEXT_224831 [Caerostris extrusa]|uniref:Uncharacterized protein n=1 Tax=Caerostris extrusa TaxID=172846 RepID=A0AAV4NEB0_CAEEX|nr:hypothetical protein CEXT_224831 [Caerostris extrusa]